MVHSTSCIREPVRQGLWGIAEVFLDTIVICTFTALVILNSGAIDLDTGLMMIPNLVGIVSQIPLIIRLTRNYTDRRIRGKAVEPLLSYDPDIQKEAARAVLKGAD